MSTKMLKHLQGFIPFVNGLHENLNREAKKCLEQTSEDVFVVKIKEDEIDVVTKKDKPFNKKKLM